MGPVLYKSFLPLLTFSPVCAFQTWTDLISLLSVRRRLRGAMALRHYSTQSPLPIRSTTKATPVSSLKQFTSTCPPSDQQERERMEMCIYSIVNSCTFKTQCEQNKLKHNTHTTAKRFCVLLLFLLLVVFCFCFC